MAASNFSECLRRLLAHEGGYTNHPSDPGGPTNFGITIADYRRYVKPGATAADVKAMRVDEAKALYKAKYWDALRCDELPAGVDDSVFDYGVNSGIGRSGKVLRRVLGLPDNDWRVTADVLAALAKRDPKAVVNAINDERLRFLQSLKTWPVFGAGWRRRVGEVRAFSLALACASPGTVRNAATVGSATSGMPPAERRDHARGKGHSTTKSGVQVGAAGGVIVASSAAAVQAQTSGAGWITVAFIAVAGVGVAAAAWIALRWWRKRRQKRLLSRIVFVPEASHQEGS